MYLEIPYAQHLSKKECLFPAQEVTSKPFEMEGMKLTNQMAS